MVALFNLIMKKSLTATTLLMGLNFLPSTAVFTTLSSLSLSPGILCLEQLTFCTSFLIILKPDSRLSIVTKLLKVYFIFLAFGCLSLPMILKDSMYGVVSAEILPSTLNASTTSVIGNITFDISYSSEKQEITEKQSFPEVWKILATPILHQYATAKGQISSVPIKYLNTSNDKGNTVTAVRRRACTNELTSFLAREIDTMKKTAKHKQPYSRIIILERI